MPMSKRPPLMDSLRPLDYPHNSLISQFDAEIAKSDCLMNLPTLFEVKMVLRVMRVLRGDRKIHR